MKKLAEIVTTYQTTITKEPAKQSAEEEDNEDIPSFEHCKHKEGKNMLLCVTCCMYVCYECTYFDHNDHQVFSEDDFGDEIEIYRRLIEDELNEVNRMIDLFEQNVYVREESMVSEEIRNEITTITKKFRESMDHQLDTAEKELSKMKKARENALKETDRELRHLSSLSKKISAKIESKTNKADLVVLQKINSFNDQISDGIKKAKIINETMQDVEINVHFRPKSLSARYISITVGPVVGSVRVNKDQVVIVTDQRHQDKPAIRLSCVSCDNTSHVNWSHVIESAYFLGYGKKLPRVAVCNNLLVLPSKIFILVGCGTKIFQVEVREPKDTCYYCSCTAKDIDLTDGSEITYINVILSPQLPAGVLVTDSVSNSITRLDRDLMPVETLELEEKPHVASGFFDQKFTYAFSDGKVVKLINGSSPKQAVRTLESPSGKETFYPVSMFHDAAAFSILWKGEGTAGEHRKPYKVMVYRSKGDLVRISCEQDQGTCSMRSEAVGISFVKNHGLICLSDGKVIPYDTL
ncbi:hypothetical protein BSL78_26159 [Apostichopus japonicus]|uniref:B box-type domain-containing protein n=1 Tax=Stichopus japonicus TaxID=307972 RepID=A0A2G8JMJ2_STIJA|nr:hypothetical protein BSL78_26159 [Apostichopus japonicus]